MAADTKTSDHRFRLHVENNQVILIVPAPAHGVAVVAAEEIVNACKSAHYRKFDEKMIRLAVDTADGKPLVIGEHEPRPATAEIAVAADEMQAWVTLRSPEPGGRGVTEDELRLAIRSARVVSGLDEAAIRNLMLTPVYGQRIEIARGKPVENGKNGEIDFRFKPVKEVHPEIDESTDRANYKELGIVENVVVDQLLAARKPPTAGEPGITVRGEHRPPVPGKPIQLYASKNARLSEDGNEARSTVNGIPLYIGGRILVSEVYQVEGGVGPATGNVDFLGSVHITGTVEDGYTVKAQDDIIVTGAVGKAMLEAGNDVLIIGGLMGKGEAKVTAGGQVQARFIQEAIVQAGNDIIVVESALHSELDAGNRIIVGLSGKKGMLCGGQVRAFKLVSCRLLGSPKGAKTTVEVGANPRLTQRCLELQDQIIHERRNFMSANKGLETLSTLRTRLGGQLPPEKDRIRQTLEVAVRSLKKRLQEMAVELNDLQGQLAKDVRAAVSIAEEVYPGVKIVIRSVPYYPQKVEKFMMLKEERGEIMIGVYEPPKLDIGRKKEKKGGKK